MAFQQGQVYRCPDPACGCELTVTKPAPANSEAALNPTCCCGKTMNLINNPPR